jgi:dCMP deaminase
MKNETIRNLINIAAKNLVDLGVYKNIDSACVWLEYHTGFSLGDHRNEAYERVSWDEYFMSLAFLVCMRSPDAQTQHGAVIVDKGNRIVATGYNGFLPGAIDNAMPNTRPKKYQHIMHAEANAILSAAQDLSECIIYITGLPCNECLKMIAKSGIKKIVVGDRMHNFAPGFFELHTLICAMHNIEIERYCGKITPIQGRTITIDDHKIPDR